MQKLDDFTRAYIECALWSTCDDDDCPLEENYDIGDISPETLAAMIADCQKFQADNGSLLTRKSYSGGGGNPLTKAGHAFWLTRNGHGAGFWDGDWTENAGAKLTEAAKAFGEVSLYVGDDGYLYC